MLGDNWRAEDGVGAEDIPASLNQEEGTTDVDEDVNVSSWTKVTETSQEAHYHDNHVIDDSREKENNVSNDGDTQNKRKGESVAVRVLEQVDSCTNRNIRPMCRKKSMQ